MEAVGGREGGRENVSKIRQGEKREVVMDYYHEEIMYPISGWV